MEDVIFSGTEQRKMLGVASVSLFLDNSDRQLDLDFNEVVITRKVYRSGESEYYINKSACRLKDIQELFMDTGVGRDGYSIISQGKIESIISSKSEERRSIFEEASGIVKYRTRKEEAIRKLEHTTENLSRVNDILFEINNTLGPLEEKSKVAKKYLELREKLKNVDVKIFLNVLDTSDKELEDVTGKIGAFDESIFQKEEEMNSLSRARDDARVYLEELLVEIEQKQEEYFRQATDLDKLKSGIENFDQRLESNKDSIAKLQQEINENSASVTVLEQEIITRSSKKEGLEQNKKRFEDELGDKTKELEEITSNMTEKELEIESLKKKVEELKEKVSEIKVSIATGEAKIEANERRIIQIEKQKDRDVLTTDGTVLEAQDVMQQLDNVKKEKETAEEKLQQILKEKNQMEQRLTSVTIKENEFKQSILEARSKYNYMINLENENEGYIKSVKSVLDTAKRNDTYGIKVFGTLASIVSTKAEYEKAIEIAMGGYIQNVIVDTDRTAKDLVKFLRDGLLGRATFLPIESIRVYSENIPSNVKKESGYIGRALDLVSYDAKFEAPVSLALGRTIVVDTIENGIKISKSTKNSAKIVTLSGEVIATTGSITGGSVQGTQMTLVGRGRKLKEYKQRLEVLEKEYEKYLEEISKDKLKYQEISARVKECLEISNEANTKYRVVEERLNASNREYTKILEEREHRKKEREELREENENLQKDIAASLESIKTINTEIENINEEIFEFERFNKDKSQRVNFLNEDIMNLKVSLSSFDESTFAIDEMVDKIKQDIDNFCLSIDRKKELIKTYEDELANSEEKRIEETKQISSLEKTTIQLKEQIEELKKNKQNNMNSSATSEKEFMDLVKDLEKLRVEKTKLDNKKIKLDSEAEVLRVKMWEDYELTYTSAKVFEAGIEGLEDVSKSKLEQMANKLKSEIKQLGEVSVSSIEEYKALKDRSEFIQKQKQDLEETKEKLVNLIENTTSVMKTQFLRQFKIINDNFKEIFKELFGGGEGSIILTDETNVLESGIEIEVQPPGKKLKKLSLLSGGEKALTSIAILFAILKIKLPPFCVLDEIEAALDDINVTRFAEYINKYSKDTQFIIITHRKGTMEIASAVYGVTMQEYGISNLVSMKMK